MPTHRSHSSKISKYVFILWGNRFEEAEAATFTTELRRSGLCVKLVGLTGQRSTGAHGLILCSDMTLGEALPLANQAICVVIPCNTAIIKHIENDPRVSEFFRYAKDKNAQFVMKQFNTMDKSPIQEIAIPLGQITTYTESEDLKEVARNVADLISNTFR